MHMTVPLTHLLRSAAILSAHAGWISICSWAQNQKSFACRHCCCCCCVQGWSTAYDFSVADLRAASDVVGRAAACSGPGGPDWRQLLGLLQVIYSGRVDTKQDTKVGWRMCQLVGTVLAVVQQELWTVMEDVQHCKPCPALDFNTCIQAEFSCSR